MDHRSSQVSSVKDHGRTSHVVEDLPPGVRILEVDQIVNKCKAFVVSEVLARTSGNAHLIGTFNEGSGLDSSEDHCILVGGD